MDIDNGFVNAKLALIDENGRVVEFDTEETSSSSRAAVNLIIARLREIFNLEEIIAAGVLDFGRDVIPKNSVGWNIVDYWQLPPGYLTVTPTLKL